MEEKDLYINKGSLFIMTEAIPKEIVTELKAIREDLEYIKKRMVGADAVMTDDDLDSLKEAEKDLKEGKTKRL